MSKAILKIFYYYF